MAASREGPTVYADEDIERPWVAALRARGLDVLTVYDAGRQAAPDVQQLAHATSLGRILLTCDGRDFRRLHARWQTEGRPHTGIVLLPQEGPLARRVIRTAMLLDWLVARGVGSQLASWGDLQLRLHRGERISGYTEEDVRLALGLGQKRGTPRW